MPADLLEPVVLLRQTHSKCRSISILCNVGMQQESGLMWGEALAIMSALTWASATVLSAEALKKVDPIRSNTVKSFFSAALLLPIAFGSGEMSNLPEVSIQALLLVIVAAIVGFGIGDTLLLQSITVVGVSKAYTITYTYPLFTTISAVILLGEPFHLTTLAGTALTVLSVVSLLSEKDDSDGKGNSRGLLMAFGTAITWAIGILLVTLGLRDLTVLQANAVRYPALSLFLLVFSKPARRWNLDRKSLLLLFASGALGMVLGGTIFLLSVNLIGASRATPLSASSPVWASLMSSLFLKEKVTPRLLISSALVVVGTYFLTL